MALFQQSLQIKRLSLIEVLALIGFLGSLFIFIILLIIYGWPSPSNRWLYLGAMASYLMIIVLNKMGHHTMAKYLLTYVGLIFSFAISIYNKIFGPIFINDYYVFRMVIITISIIPILVFKYNQYVHLSLNMLPSFLALVFFDLIHDAFGIGIFSTGYEDQTYTMTTYVSIMCYLALNGFLYTIKRKNDIYLEELSQSNRELEDQYEELRILNDEIESKNALISDQNSQLTDFSKKLKEKVKQRTKDLTKLNKELVEQNARLEQFTFITAHNIKSPLTQIKGLLNLLHYENNLSENTNAILEKIEGSCLNLEEVIADLNKILNIKNHSRIIEKINLAELIDHIIFNLKDDMNKKQISIRKNYQPLLEIKTIKAFLYSILYNLIHNAVKYYDPEKECPEINLTVIYNENYFTITIEDNGIGFEQDRVKDKLFQLYQRFNTNVVGKGLGLFLVKEQIGMINGDIQVDSKVGKGTRFIVKVPRIEDVKL